MLGKAIKYVPLKLGKHFSKFCPAIKNEYIYFKSKSYPGH